MSSTSSYKERLVRTKSLTRLPWSPQAAGAANVQVRFHYYQAAFEWYWIVDNVKVTFVGPGSCAMNTCVSASLPPPVPDGSFGTGMKASRSGSAITLTWDVATCSGADYHLLYGALATVSSFTVSGAVCDLGVTGAQVWPSVPAGNLWFVLVADDNATTEGSWGSATSGPRGGTAASGLCSAASRTNAGTCP